MKKCMLVSSPGGQLRSHISCPRVIVSIGRVKFSTNLMVIDTKGIDVILGMDTLASGESELIVLSGQFTCQHLMAKR